MSQFVVSARKYRPQRFDEVVGQNHVANTLKNALVSNQLAHAFLFCGPRGVGKTTCARILAKVLNCQNLQNQVDPCNECSSCKSFNDNASFNIIELDAASNNSVEHIRNLIEQVRFQPQQGSHKVFIIDEVHMLSSQAFNAFLKTLEEPPPYAIFILATTEKHKIIPTILSRCQIFDFKRIQNEAIVEQLVSISDKEGISYEPEALNIIAQKSDGAMRDALSIFDKIVSSSDRKVTYNAVIENLNILDYEYFFSLTNAFLKEDFPSVMNTFEEITHKGFDPELCMQGLAEHIRELMVAKSPQTINLLNVSDQLKQRYLDQSGLCTMSFLMGSLNILNNCDIHFQKAKNKRLHAEIALSKITFLGRASEVSALVEEKKTKKSTSVVHPEVKAEETKIEAPTTTTAAVNPETEQEKDIPADIDEPAKENGSATLESKTSAPEDKPVKKKGLLKISFSSEEELDSRIRSEEKQKEKKPKQLSVELIEKIWEDHLSNHHSPSVKSSLKTRVIEVEGKKIYVHLPTPSVLNTVNQEESLVVKIREHFDIENLEFLPQVNSEKFPEYKKFIPKKIMSPREKYEFLLKRNPELAGLKEKFGLEVDSE